MRLVFLGENSEIVERRRKFLKRAAQYNEYYISYHSLLFLQFLQKITHLFLINCNFVKKLYIKIPRFNEFLSC